MFYDVAELEWHFEANVIISSLGFSHIVIPNKGMLKYDWNSWHHMNHLAIPRMRTT